LTLTSKNEPTLNWVSPVTCRVENGLAAPGAIVPPAAAHVGISLRTLHSRFGQIGQTFGRWVLQSRLEACARALRDPNQRHLNISEIAYRWGFNDLSHFNRAFRAHFDLPPGEWRNAAVSRPR
jgi:AraC-like DNA-binding protein